MHRYEALEGDRPCRIAKSILQGTEYLAHACFARVCRDEDVLDVLCLGGRELCRNGKMASLATGIWTAPS
jgi:hypothetical protein